MTTSPRDIDGGQIARGLIASNPFSHVETAKAERKAASEDIRRMLRRPVKDRPPRITKERGV